MRPALRIRTRRSFEFEFTATYDGAPLGVVHDDDLPAGPCGQAVNQVKLRFYRLCRRLDPDFKTRELSDVHKRAEQCALRSVYAREDV